MMLILPPRSELVNEFIYICEYIYIYIRGMLSHRDKDTNQMIMEEGRL